MIAQPSGLATEEQSGSTITPTVKPDIEMILSTYEPVIPIFVPPKKREVPANAFRKPRRKK